MRPSLSKILLSLDSVHGRQVALNHVLSSLTINFARLALVRVFSFLNLGPSSAGAASLGATAVPSSSSMHHRDSLKDKEEAAVKAMAEKGFPQSASTVPLIGGGSSSSGMNSPVGKSNRLGSYGAASCIVWFSFDCITN